MRARRKLPSRRSIEIGRAKRYYETNYGISVVATQSMGATDAYAIGKMDAGAAQAAFEEIDRDRTRQTVLRDQLRHLGGCDPKHGRDRRLRHRQDGCGRGASCLRGDRSRSDAPNGTTRPTTASRWLRPKAWARPTPTPSARWMRARRKLPSRRSIARMSRR